VPLGYGWAVSLHYGDSEHALRAQHNLGRKRFSLRLYLEAPPV